MIDRAQAAAAQPLRERIGVDLVTLVSLAGLAPLIAHDHPIDEGDQQLMQSLRLGPYLDGDVNRSAQAAEPLEERRLLGRQDGPRNRPAHSPSIPRRPWLPDARPAALADIAFGMIASDHFMWHGDEADGARVSETLYDWSALEVNYPLNSGTVAKFRQFVWGRT